MAIVNYQARLAGDSPFYTGNEEGLVEEHRPGSVSAYTEPAAEGTYKSYAQRQLARREEQTASIAQNKQDAKRASEYDLAEIRQVEQQVAEEYEQADTRLRELAEAVAPMREAVNEMLRQIDGRRTTAAKAMAFIEDVRREIARVAERRDELAKAIRVAELKAKYSHSYLDAMFNTYPYLARPSVFGENTDRPSSGRFHEEPVSFVRSNG